MRFEDPEYLFLLLLIPFLFYLRRLSSGALKYSSLVNLKKIKYKNQFHPKTILLVLRSMGLALVVLALARPQQGKKFSEILSEGVDIILALDTSGSMQALDFKLEGKRVTRLDIVKNVVADFVKKRPNDRMGLVVFGEEAFTQCPLTLDHGIIFDFLKKIELGMAGDATAIGSAIGVSVNRVKNLKSKSKVIVLLTDGESNAGRLSPLQAAEAAKAFGIKIYTIGAGTKGQAPFLAKTIFGEQLIYQPVNIDEGLLKEIAQMTGAKYFRATNSEELRNIYDEIDKLETTQVKVKEYSQYNEIFHYFLFAALGIFFLEFILSQTRLRILP